MSTDDDAVDTGRRGLVLGAAGLLGAAGALVPGRAATAAPAAVASGLSCQFIGQWDAAKLNRILTRDAPGFFGLTVAFTPARHGVKLYRVNYPSVVPEQGNRPIAASGLIAIPDAAGTEFPLLSYQHGTVYGKQEVPSHPEQSPETALVLAQFAGQGYIVIGADYFGMGESHAPEGYLVKASHQQATADMLRASQAVLASLNRAATKTFLAGWSQGGFVTMAMLERLEADNVALDAAATASAPVDGFVGFSGFLDFPRANDASWVTTLFILTGFSFEHYYGVPGLARALINEKYYDISKKLYERQKFDFADVPTSVKALVRPEYFKPQFFADSAYGRLITEHMHAYRWIVRAAVRNYYGEKDEVISVGLGRLAMNYQQAIGSGNNKVEAISTGPTDHRGTFMTAVPQWKTWFDTFLT